MSKDILQGGPIQWGWIKISVVPLKAEVWHAKRRAWDEEQRRREAQRSMIVADAMEESIVCYSMSAPMGLAAGGRMRQVIYPDPFKLEDWDIAAADRVFVTLLHAKDWKAITGEAAPNEPPTARAYSDAGLPWFEYYGKDQAALPGSAKLAGVTSRANLFKKKTGATLPQSQDIVTGTPKPLGPGKNGPRPVRTESSWDQ
jgi:hypothetical protein